MADEGPVGEEGIPQDVITFLNTHTPDKVRAEVDEDMPLSENVCACAPFHHPMLPDFPRPSCPSV